MSEEKKLIQITVPRHEWDKFKKTCKSIGLDRKRQAEIILEEMIKKFNEENADERS